jgi:hypothetical protein
VNGHRRTAQRNAFELLRGKDEAIRGDGNNAAKNHSLCWGDSERTSFAAGRSIVNAGEKEEQRAMWLGVYERLRDRLRRTFPQQRQQAAVGCARAGDH